MTVDPELVRRKARLILEDLAILEPIAALSLDDYRANVTNELVVERLLERIIGRMIDTNYHLAVGLGGMPPKDYFQSFVSLATLGVMPRQQAQELAVLAGLRNRLAHQYNGLDDALVHTAAQRCLTDVPDYLRALERFSESLQGTSS